jgi:poly(A) polymerase
MLAEAVMPRFRADNALSEEVDHLIRWQGALSRLPDPEDRPALRRFVRTHGKFLEPLLACVEAIARVEAPDKEAAKAHIKRAREVIEAERLAGTLVPELPAGVGKAVMEAWGLRPGPLVGEIKAYLEERILDGTLENRRGSDYYVASLKVAPPDFLLQPSNRPS